MNICPITGKPCNKAKNVLIQKLDYSGSVSEYECCGECVDNINSPFASNLLHNLGVLNLMQLQQTATCTCGASLQEIKVKGIGCPQCYITFKEDLEALILRLQAGTTEHKGKTPQPKDTESLKREMKKAVQEERYEDAAKYRDRIKSLEQAVYGN